MNILVTGANGQLGKELQALVRNKQNSIQHNFFFTDRNDLDITDKKSIENFLTKKEISTIINCAAYTAVDKAEEERELADLINHKSVEILANSAKEHDIPLIHISTDYVFDGTSCKPYKETDPTNPQNIYGYTKLKGEEAFLNYGARGIIIRTSWVYSPFGKNFVKTMLSLAKSKKELRIIYDQIGSPTYAKDLAKTIFHIIQNPKFTTLHSVEIYHYSNEGVCSWYDFAKAIFDLQKIDIKVSPIETEEYPTPAKRPNYSVLSKKKIKEDFDIEIPYWRDSLKECLGRIMSDEL